MGQRAEETGLNIAFWGRLGGALTERGEEGFKRERKRLDRQVSAPKIEGKRSPETGACANLRRAKWKHDL